MEWKGNVSRRRQHRASMGFEYLRVTTEKQETKLTKGLTKASLDR